MSNLSAGRKYNNLAAALRFALEQERKTFYTVLPGIVVAFNAAAQTVDVRGAIDVQTTSGELIERAVLRDVPLVYPQGGGYSITWPLQEGDNVLLLFSMRGLEHWRETRGRAAPGDGLLEELDAIAVPGFAAVGAPAAPTDKLIVDGDQRIEIIAPEIELTGTLTNNGLAIGAGGSELPDDPGQTSFLLYSDITNSLIWSNRDFYSLSSHNHNTLYALINHAHGGNQPLPEFPTVDSLLFYDHSDGAAEWVHASGYSPAGHTHPATGLPEDPDTDALLRWDDSAGALEWAATSEYAGAGHLHDARYARTVHVHPYAPEVHVHPSELPLRPSADAFLWYDQSEDSLFWSATSAWAPATHGHTAYSLTSHLHDARYSQTGHLHSIYATTTHTHPATQLPPDPAQHSLLRWNDTLDALQWRAETDFATSGHTHTAELPATGSLTQDQLLLWDESDGAVEWINRSAFASSGHDHLNLALATHNHAALYSPIGHTHTGGTSLPADPGADSLLFWDDSDSAVEWVASSTFAASGHSHTIGSLLGVPNNYGTSGQVLAVKSDRSGLEYVTPPTGGGGTLLTADQLRGILPLGSSTQDQLAFWDADNDNDDGTTGAWEVRNIAGPDGFSRGNHTHPYAPEIHTHPDELPLRPSADALLWYDQSEDNLFWLAASFYSPATHTHPATQLPADPNHDGLLAWDDDQSVLYWLATTAFATSGHNHDAAYAALAHAHAYAATSHLHDARYAALAHTHPATGLPNDPDTDALLLWDDSASALAWTAASGFSASGHTHPASGLPTAPEYHGLLSITSSDDENTPSTLGWLHVTALATAGHNHAGVYAALAHAHSGYAATNHSHTGFAALGHNHNAAYAALVHTHTGFALTAHNHNSAYSQLGHTHTAGGIRNPESVSTDQLLLYDHSAGDVVWTAASAYLGGAGGLPASPSADSLLFYDHSDAAAEWIAASTYAAAAHSHTAQLPTNATEDSLAFWDHSDSAWETRPVAGPSGFSRGNHSHTVGALTDVPNAFGTEGQVLAVNSDGDALEYVTPATGGTALPSDPGADSLLLWDDSDSAVEWTAASNFAAHDHTHSGGTSLPADPGADSLLFYDHSDAAAEWIAASTYAAAAHSHATEYAAFNHFHNRTLGSLTDVPSQRGTAGQILAVNSGRTAVEWVDQPAGTLPDDPDADSLLFWDDSDGAAEWVASSGFSASGHTHDNVLPGGADEDADSILFWDHDDEAPEWRTQVDSAQIADNSITTTKLGAGQVTHDKIAQGNSGVRTNNIANSAVTTTTIQTGAVTNDKLADDSVDLDKLAHDASLAGKYIGYGAGGTPMALSDPTRNLHQTGVWWEEDTWHGSDDWTIDDGLGDDITLTEAIYVVRDIIVENAGSVTDANTFRVLRTSWPVTMIIARDIKLHQSLRISADGRSGVDGAWPRDGVSGDGGYGGSYRHPNSEAPNFEAEKGMHGSWFCGGGGGGGWSRAGNQTGSVADPAGGENYYAAGSTFRFALLREVMRNPAAFQYYGGGHGGNGGTTSRPPPPKLGGAGGGIVILILSGTTERESGSTRWRLDCCANGFDGEAGASIQGAGGGGGGGSVVIFFGSAFNDSQIQVTYSATGGSGGAQYGTTPNVSGGAGANGGNGFVWQRVTSAFLGIPGSI